MQQIKFISLGPGGRDNVSLGAYDAMKEADNIYCFGSKGYSYASTIIEECGIEKDKIKVVDIPMSEDRTAAYKVYDTLVETIAKEEGHIAVATEGDTGIFATTHYVMDRLIERGMNIIQMPGIPSFIAAGALSRLSLVSKNERLLIVPGNITEEEIEHHLSQSCTIVIMKLSRMNDIMHKFISYHKEYQYHYVEKIGTAEQTHITDRSTLLSIEYPYFSIMIIKK